MNRKIIFFQWSNLDKNKDYGYIINWEAIQKRKMRIINGPNSLKHTRIGEIHKEICEKCPTLSKLWYREYIKDIHLNKGQHYVLMFNEWHPALKNIDFFVWLKKNYRVELVLVLRNMIYNKSLPEVNGIKLDLLKKTFDLIATDEKKDAVLYDLFFAPDPFSQIYKKELEIQNDICFTGADKGRIEIIKQIAKKAIINNATYDFKIIGAKRKNISLLEYVEWQPYFEIIKQDMRSNCILEVLQPGQESFTLRFQEAVCLRKKLLTNNYLLINEKYYNPNFIQIFSDVNEIDWDFVKEREPVDYGYNGEFSPIVFLKKIIEELERRRLKHD